MNLNLEVKYIRQDKDNKNYVCFRHAVQLASQGIDIKPEIDEYGSDYDMRSTWCRSCSEEKK